MGLSSRYAALKSVGSVHKTAYDNKAYTRGWNNANRITTDAGVERALDRAYARNEPSEWFDGWYDAEAGRPKWYLRDNPEG